MVSSPTAQAGPSGQAPDAGSQPPRSRLERRKAHTRQALVAAAQRFLAEQGSAEVSIQEITDNADVGFGSFYNHFTSKLELFQAAIDEVLEEHGQMLDEYVAGIDDPAEVFAASMRMTVRLAQTHPRIARILSRTGLASLDSDRGLAPRALRDIQRAIATGRFTITNPHVALATTGGALLAILHLLLERPDLAGEHPAEELTEQLLRGFGMTHQAAYAIAYRPLPQSATP
ncbi:MAG TPA: TetR/AcrR family transcriptional regulator [Streptosporangiaceae bacterium]|nr:TetR/AcrR family transcriptional regulator [Streptosporangiaceae bacterium]